LERFCFFEQLSLFDLGQLDTSGVQGTVSVPHRT
jgi:hypothetical protein